MGRLSTVIPEPSGPGWALAHTPAYIDDVQQGRLPEAMQRAIGLPWSPALVERSRRSVGATVGAARAALREPAAEARALEVQVVAQHVEKRGGRVDLDFVGGAVDAQGDGWHGGPPGLASR